ncbi:helix-turn-helix transcriptional regulator [Listeria booriae]|uniref:helix-turn-helix domain-containing protein n=1 Tax=Listeria booriae TaxID=1552123 RepID=UPI00162A5016|nr:helix-turn-helix transcriptional regulator [Listeria booriae]MBC1284870.1 helix-turn-helix transcriptional regulator [Listeria booriae]
MKSNKYHVGKEIKLIRLSLGVTLEQFSQMFTPPTTPSIVSKWERGVSLPKPDRLKKIAEISGQSVDDILFPVNDQAHIQKIKLKGVFYLRVKRGKDGDTFVCSRDLKKELKNCEAEMRKIELELPYLKFASEQAQKPYIAKKKRLEALKEFVPLAKKKLNE